MEKNSRLALHPFRRRHPQEVQREAENDFDRPNQFQTCPGERFVL